MVRFRFEECRGAWAVVTGASSGIGRALALELAQRGMRVALVARQSLALQQVADEIRIGGGEAVVIELDLAQPGSADRLRAALQQQGCTPLRLLVNNAGVGAWGPFVPEQLARYDEMVALNMAAVVNTTAALLPDLRRHTPSAVLNVSSQAAYQPVPYMAVYAATKAFVHSFSLALRQELSDSGVLIQGLVPGPTETDFDRRAGAYGVAPMARGTPAQAAHAGLEGLERGVAVTSNAPGLWRQRFFAGVLPHDLLLREVAKLFRPRKS